MIATMQDLVVRTRADFEHLPDDGLWEVVDGRAVLLPANDIRHQALSGRMFLAIAGKLKELGRGVVLVTVNVGIPVPKTSRGEIQNRVPDLVVAEHQPEGQFAAGDPPELAIEILSTPRGNVERTEKIDDYARAGIREYWVVNPFFHEIEVYVLDGDSYRQMQPNASRSISSQAFTGLTLDLTPIWAPLD